MTEATMPSPESRTTVPTSGSSRILGFVVFLLVLSNGWLFYSLTEVQNNQANTARILGTTQKDLTHARDNVDVLLHNLGITSNSLEDTQQNVVSVLSALDAIYLDLDTLFGSVRSLRSGLNYATSLAENGNLHAHTHPYSDARLKQDITPLTPQLEKVMALRAVRFHWNHDASPSLRLGDREQMGLIAQEVELLYPELVATGTDGYKTLDYEQLIPVLVQALQEQQAQIEALETKIGQGTGN